MPRIVIWEQPMKDYIVKNYFYDELDGRIYKQDMCAMGTNIPRKEVGSISASGDKMTNISFGGKVWGTRLVKMAVFLKTLKQHTKFDFVDGNPFNLKWENIKTLDAPLSNLDDYNRNKEQEVLAQLAERNKRRTDLARLDEEKANNPNFRKLSAHKYVELTPEQLERKERKTAEEEKIKRREDSAKDFLLSNPLGYVTYDRERQDWAVIDQLRHVLYTELDGKCAHLNYLNGIVNTMDYDGLKRFFDDCNKYSGTSYASYQACIDDYVKRPELGGNFAELEQKVEKWVHDRVMAAAWLKWTDSGQTTKISVGHMCRDYKWKGEPASGMYARWTPEVQAEYSERNKFIEAEEARLTAIRAEENLAAKRVREEQASQEPKLEPGETRMPVPVRSVLDKPTGEPLAQSLADIHSRYE